MHAQPAPAWYLYALDAAEPVHLLTDESHPSPELNTEPARLLAELAAAIHARAWRLGERELRTLEQCIALQRCMRPANSP